MFVLTGNAATAWVVASNLFAVIPLSAALSRKLWWEGLVVARILFISTFYHLCGGGVVCLGGTSISTWVKADFYASFDAMLMVAVYLTNIRYTIQWW